MTTISQPTMMKTAYVINTMEPSFRSRSHRSLVVVNDGNVRFVCSYKSYIVWLDWDTQRQLTPSQWLEDLLRSVEVVDNVLVQTEYDIIHGPGTWLDAEDVPQKESPPTKSPTPSSPEEVATTFTVRMLPEDISRLKQLASKLGMRHTTLARNAILAYLEESWV